MNTKVVSKSQLIVTLAQWTWAQNTMTRLAANVNREPNKRMRAAVIAFADKLAIPPEQTLDGKVVLASNRNELRILEKLVSSHHGLIVTTLIPGYQDKLNAGQDVKKYLKASEQQASMLLDLANTIKKRLV